MAWIRVIGMAVLCGILAGFACGDDGVAPVQHRLTPSFPYQDGWLGGDAAYSISLGGGRSVWLFGDTYVKPPPAEQAAALRRGAKFVRNSIAISTSDTERGWRIKYYWRDPEAKTPKAFFKSGSDQFWYWPLDGFMHDGRLYVALSMLKDKPGNGVFSFEAVGVRLARVANPSAPPEEWKIDYLKFVDEGSSWPGSAIVVLGDYALFITLCEDRPRHQQHMILTRVALAELDRPAEHLEYLALDKSWKRGLNPDDALTVLPTGHSEMSVRYHQSIGRWVAVTGGDFLSNKIMIRTAPAPEGPWSAPQVACEMPEMDPKTAGYDIDTFGYAAKEHVEFATDDKLLITYACNSFKFEKAVGNMNIYRPQAVWIDLPRPPR